MTLGCIRSHIYNTIQLAHAYAELLMLRSLHLHALLAQGRRKRTPGHPGRTWLFLCQIMHLITSPENLLYTRPVPWLRTNKSGELDLRNCDNNIKLSLKVKVAQSCPTLCDLMGYTVHGILQTGILEWVAFPFSRGSSQSRDQTRVSHIAGRFFTS